MLLHELMVFFDDVQYLEPWELYLPSNVTSHCYTICAEMKMNTGL